ncbi:MAG: carbohydrate ABC transporter permease [Clostridia bacterium]|nr:carbohydrate ABC transporter permease [Clostridia bacterium]
MMIFDAVNVMIMLLLVVIILVPVLSVVVNSFVSASEIARRGVFILWPEDIDLGSYEYLWNCRSNIIRAYSNTLFRTIVGTFLSLTVTALMAYSLSKRYLKGRISVNGLVFFTMLFSGGLIPGYMVVKLFGLIDSRWSLIIPGLVSAWNMFIMRNFFYAIPESLEEAALIDGANQWQIFYRVTLPLSQAVLATIGLFYAVGHWNSWFDAMLYINSYEKLPMQNILRNIINSVSDLEGLGAEQYEMMDVKPASTSLRCAVIVVTATPIIVVYPFVQKYFVKGVMVGSVKG